MAGINPDFIIWQPTGHGTLSVGWLLIIIFCLYHTYEKCKGAEFLLETWGRGIPAIVHPRLNLRLLCRSAHPKSVSKKVSNLYLTKLSRSLISFVKWLSAKKKIFYNRIKNLAGLSKFFQLGVLSQVLYFNQKTTFEEICK